MKKIVLSLSLIFIVFVFIGCGSDGEADLREEILALENRIEALETEIEILNISDSGVAEELEELEDVEDLEIEEDYIGDDDQVEDSPSNNQVDVTLSGVIIIGEDLDAGTYNINTVTEWSAGFLLFRDENELDDFDPDDWESRGHYGYFVSSENGISGFILRDGYIIDTEGTSFHFESEWNVYLHGNDEYT